MKIAFFDFDGTITRGDSLFAFMSFLLGKKAFYIGVLKNSHWLCAYFLKCISNARAKEKLVEHCLGGMREDFFLQKCDEFLPFLEQMIKPSALERIRWHHQMGDKIVIVSATFESYLKPWCQKEGLECIATQLEMRDGRLSGKLASVNCYGIQKVQRIKERYLLSDYEEIYAYGDSRGDKEMLELGTYSFFRFFH